MFSPRLAFVIKPATDQTFRLSYNRAFRAPSMINNNLDVAIGTPLPLATVNGILLANKLPALFSPSGVYYVPTRATGSKDLTEEHIDAFEVSAPDAWSGHAKLVMQRPVRRAVAS